MDSAILNGPDGTSATSESRFVTWDSVGAPIGQR